MGDIGDYWREAREYQKEQREKRNKEYEPKLIEIGAIEKSSGIYEYNGWFCYPTKGFAMNKKNCKQKMNLNKFLEKVKNELQNV